MAAAATRSIEARAQAFPVFIRYLAGDGIGFLKAGQGGVEEILIVAAHASHWTAHAGRAAANTGILCVVTESRAGVTAIAIIVGLREYDCSAHAECQSCKRSAGKHQYPNTLSAKTCHSTPLPLFPRYGGVSIGIEFGEGIELRSLNR